MREDLFIYFTTDNVSGKKCTSKWLYKNNFELYSEIIKWSSDKKNIRNIEFKRIIYHYINNLMEVPVCLECGKETKYKRIKDGYQLLCSSKCQYSSKIVYNNWLNSWEKNNTNDDFIKKRFKTIIEKYGSLDEYNKIMREKHKENSLKKHGVEYIMQTEDFKEKRRRT